MSKKDYGGEAELRGGIGVPKQELRHEIGEKSRKATPYKVPKRELGNQFCRVPSCRSGGQETGRNMEG
jgi:hypothetical protein